MKKTRKLISLLMALAMIFALAVPAFAAQYSIIIKDAAAGETYSAYKVFDIASYDENDSEKVSYTIESDSTFYNAVSGSNLFTLTQIGDSNIYLVELKDSETSAEEILKVLESVDLSSVNADDTIIANGNGNAMISLNDAGYYYVTTTLGSVVAVDSTNPTAVLTEKWPEPTAEKKETSDGTAGVGDTVNFEVTIKDAANIAIADSSFSSAAATASWTIKGDPERYLEGYELYMKGNTRSPKAVDYQTLLITGPSVNGNGALYRILLYDGDLSVSEVCSKMYSEFNATISSGAYANKSYKDCVQNAIDARVIMEVYHLENTSEDESVWAVIELVYGLSEEPSLC